MVVTEIQIITIKPKNGLIAFASCVIDKQLYISSIGVHRRLDGMGYRITYPSMLVGSKRMDYFHPITKQAGKAIEEAVVKKCEKLFEGSDDKHGRHNQTSFCN